MEFLFFETKERSGYTYQGLIRKKNLMFHGKKFHSRFIFLLIQTHTLTTVHELINKMAPIIN